MKVFSMTRAMVAHEALAVVSGLLRTEIGWLDSNQVTRSEQGRRLPNSWQVFL